LLRAHATTTRLLSAELQAEHGLTINDYEALLVLSRADERRLKRVDLARRLVLTPSGVTRLLEGLERAGLVERATCSSDLRVTYAQLTDAGAARLEAASCAHVGSVRALFEEQFTAQEVEVLAALLGKLPGGTHGDEACTPD
jgi:DNA-binding MarR family transcriptional regulator